MTSNCDSSGNQSQLLDPHPQIDSQDDAVLYEETKSLALEAKLASEQQASQADLDPKALEKTRWPKDDPAEESSDDEDEVDIGDDETPREVKDLLEAAETNNLQAVRAIHNQDPDLINKCDIDGYTPLHRACYNGNTRVVVELLKRGANPRAKTKEGWEPIHCAAKWSHVKTLSILLQNGADPNAKTYGDQTVLHIAAMVGKPKGRLILEMLLFRDDIDIHARNAQGETAYQVAYRSGPFYRLWNHVPGFNLKMDS